MARDYDVAALYEYIAPELGYPSEAVSDSGELVDSDTYNRIIGYIRSGIYRLNEIAGAEINYWEDLAAKALLKDYCRYENAHAGESFETVYLPQLTSLNLKYRVKEIEDDEEND